MVVIVVLGNLLIALLCLAGAWWFVKLRRSLASVTATLTAAERSTHRLLVNAPVSITRGQIGLYELRQAYQQSGSQWQRVRRALLLLGLGRSIWQPRLRPRIGLRQPRR